MYHPPDFNRVFRDGEIFKRTVYTPVREQILQIEVVSLGELFLPTGKIVAFDPSYSRFEVFDRSVPAGRYPVWLALAHTDDMHKNVCVASAMIKFQEQENCQPMLTGMSDQFAAFVGKFQEWEVADWEIALLSPRTSTTKQTENYYCYGVDAGMGSFADEKAASILVKRTVDSDDYIAFYNEIDKNSVLPNRQCTNLILDSKTGLNICVFNSGYGDGCYPSYWGIGADGSIVSLVTDFMLGEVDEKDEE